MLSLNIYSSGQNYSGLVSKNIIELWKQRIDRNNFI